MKRIFCFATGNVWRWMKGDNRAELIKYAQKLEKIGIRGVELTFGTKEDLYNTKLNSAQIKWLRKLDYVSIHAPFRLVRKAENEEEIIKQLDFVQRLYKLIKAKNVIIHPNDLPPRKVLNSYDMNFSTENLPKKRHITVRKLNHILKKYPGMGLCLDVSHAYLWSKHETTKLVKAFKDKITQIHLSGTYKRKDHVHLQHVTPMFLKSIEPIKKLRVPIVIEEDIKTESMRFVKKEISYIKSLF